MRVYRGTAFGAAHDGRWIVAGPLSLEVHPRWFRVGVGLSPWCVAVYLGWLVVAVGARRWRRPVSTANYTVTWTL